MHKITLDTLVKTKTQSAPIKKRGHPFKNEEDRRTHKVVVHLTQKELESLKSVCAKRSVSLAVFVRMQALLGVEND